MPNQNIIEPLQKVLRNIVSPFTLKELEVFPREGQCAEATVNAKCGVYEGLEDISIILSTSC